MFNRSAIKNSALLIYLFFSIGVVHSAPVRQDKNSHSESPTNVFENAERLSKAVPELRKLQAKIPKQLLTVDGLVEHAEFEAEKIVAYINANVALQPYLGVMQDNNGVVTTAKGNALETSRLLMTALELAGLEARMVESTLDDAAVDSLLIKMFQSTPASQWQLTTQEIETALANIGTAAGSTDSQLLIEQYRTLIKSTPWDKSTLKQRSDATAEKLQKVLEASGVKFQTAKLTENIRKSFRSYYFVQYRPGSGHQWQAAYPGFGKKPDNLAEVAYFREIPDAMYHRVTIQAFVETLLDGKNTSTAVSSPMEFRAEALALKRLRYSASPNIGGSDLDELVWPLDVQEVPNFLPTINGEPMEGAKAFTPNGETLSLAEAFDEFGKVGSQARKQITTATDLLSSSTAKNDSQTDSQRLISHYIEIERISVQNEREKVRRYLYRAKSDLSGKQIALNITQDVTFALLAHANTAAAKFSSDLDKLIAFVVSLKEASSLQNVSRFRLNQHFEQHLARHRDNRFAVPLELEAEVLNEDQHVVRRSPYVSAIWNRFTVNSQKEQTIYDVVFDEAIALARVEEGVQADPHLNFLSGVWLTYAEAGALGGINESKSGYKTNFLPVSEQFERASKNQQVKLQRDLPLIAHRYPRYLYVSTADSGDAASFYRVDVESGRALGFNPEGLGAVSKESVILLKVVVAHASMFMKMMRCPSDGGGGQQPSCLFCALVLAEVASASAFAPGTNEAASLILFGFFTNIGCDNI